jgi:Cys-tRNA synthase (O-phospho-L-seryl-tRNA:Cys-tRNA synthase)
MPISIEENDRKMTPEQHAAKSRRIERKIRQWREKMKTLPSLAEKIEAKRQIKLLDEQLRHHKLNFFDLTTLA